MGNQGISWNGVRRREYRTSLQPLPHPTLLSPAPSLPQFYSTIEGKLPTYNTRIALPLASLKDKFFGQYGQGKEAGLGAQADQGKVVPGLAWGQLGGWGPVGDGKGWEKGNLSQEWEPGSPHCPAQTKRRVRTKTTTW